MGKDSPFILGTTLKLLSRTLYHKEETQTQPVLPKSLGLARGEGLTSFFRLGGCLAHRSRGSPGEGTFPAWSPKGRGQGSSPLPMAGEPLNKSPARNQGVSGRVPIYTTCQEQSWFIPAVLHLDNKVVSLARGFQKTLHPFHSSPQGPSVTPFCSITLHWTRLWTEVKWSQTMTIITWILSASKITTLPHSFLWRTYFSPIWRNNLFSTLKPVALRVIRAVSPAAMKQMTSWAFFQIYSLIQYSPFTYSPQNTHMPSKNTHWLNTRPAPSNANTSRVQVTNQFTPG